MDRFFAYKSSIAELAPFGKPPSTPLDGLKMNEPASGYGRNSDRRLPADHALISLPLQRFSCSGTVFIITDCRKKLKAFVVRVDFGMTVSCPISFQRMRKEVEVVK